LNIENKVMATFIRRTSVRFNPDPARVSAILYNPGPEARVNSIITKVSEMPETAAMLALNQVMKEFVPRHRNLSKTYLKHFQLVVANADFDQLMVNQLSEQKKLLIGAYFTAEHSIESAALYNPAIVEDPDQSGLESGYKRLIIAFRASGGSYVSSIVFRSAVIDNNDNIFLAPVSPVIDNPEISRNSMYDKSRFTALLHAMDIHPTLTNTILSHINSTFTYQELEATIHKYGQTAELTQSETKAIKSIKWLADSYAELFFPYESDISERMIPPLSEDDINGVEDSRFVKFSEDDGQISYYATTHSFNGITFLPKLIHTKDFLKFNIRPLQGEKMMNRGMALFPRKINGKYAMLGRLDGINNYVLYSDAIDVWNTGYKIQEPAYPWEFVQIGNCGSPIETQHGWIVITHGVGPMRKYCLGAILLDLNDPTKVIGQLSEPLLYPHEQEKNGMKPNTVYSCGSVIHNNRIILPYSIGDTYSGIAIVPLDEIFHRILPSGGNIPIPSEKPSVKGRILLVEDDLIQQKIVASILRADGYEVEIAGDGIVALMKLSKSEFNLVVSDINMPNFDGIQLIEYLNQNNIHIPLIFLTSLHDTETLEQTRQLGAKDFLNKPVNRALLLEKISSVIG
jgi:predicted GH43/DUF377 family glycosyl hydrolase